MPWPLLVKQMEWKENSCHYLQEEIFPIAYRMISILLGTTIGNYFYTLQCRKLEFFLTRYHEGLFTINQIILARWGEFCVRVDLISKTSATKPRSLTLSATTIPRANEQRVRPAGGLLVSRQVTGIILPICILISLVLIQNIRCSWSRNFLSRGYWTEGTSSTCLLLHFSQNTCILVALKSRFFLLKVNVVVFITVNCI